MNAALVATTDNETQNCLWDVSNAEYYSAHEYVSHSALELFRDSPLGYQAMYVLGTMPKKRPTDQMILGTAMHVQILEPDRWDELIIVAPACDRRTTLGKASWASFNESSVGKTVITQEQNAACIAMAKSACAHPEVQELMRHAWRREQAMKCTLPMGLPAKCKADLICRGPLIVDFKSSASPAPDAWAKQAANLGYHRQAALYVDIAKLVLGKNYQFIHVVVQNEEPWEVACYCLDESAIELGRSQNATDLAMLRECYETDEWRQLQNKSILKLKLPKWAANIE